MSEATQKTAKPGGPAGPVLLYWPNLITYGRILAVPLVAGLLMYGGDRSRWVALGIFIIAGVSDFVDGYLARLWKMQSSLGRMLDPIADKLLVAAVLLILVGDGTLSDLNQWAAIIILCREILVSGLREYLAELRVPVPVTRLAKYKTAVQMVAIGFLIAGPAGDKVLPHTTEIGIAGLWIAAILTLYTGFDYFRAGITHLTDE